MLCTHFHFCCAYETSCLPAAPCLFRLRFAANTIFGDNNPSGRLPVSFPAPPASGSGYATDTWLSPPGGGPVIPTEYPGTDRGNGFPEVDYAEGLFM